MRWNCIYAGFCLHLILVLLTSCSAPADSGNNDVQGNTNANQRPVAVILPATEQSVIVGDRIRFRGDNSYDPDNNTVLAYQWTFSGAQTSITQSGISNPTVTFNQTGSVTTTLTVSDSLGLRSVPVSVRINVAAVGSNLPPNGSISHDAGIGANGSTGNFSIISGTTAVFQGSGSDPENDTLTYLWSFPNGVTAPTSPGSSPFNVSFPNTGSFTISLSVRDSAGNTDPTPASVTVSVGSPGVNQAPNGSISHDAGSGASGSTGNFSIISGTTAVFQGSGSDPENDTLTYLWSFPNGVTAPTSPGSSPFNVSFPNTGNFTISLSVWDSAGNTDPTPASVTVSVGSPGVNQAPNGSISHDDGSGSPGTLGDLDIVTGTRVVYSGSAIDPEGDPINFTWTLDGTQPTTAGGSGPISVRYNTPGTFSVRLSVSDNQGNTDPSPAIINVRVNPGFQYLPLMHDEDGNPNNTTARYSLSVDDNVNVSVMTPTATWTTSMMRYNNLHLPPVIKARRGTSLTFNVRNNLNEATTVHWHGFKIPAAQDGGPDMPINARASRNYNYTLVQPAAPLWFHPHVHESTATQVYKGLAGALIVTDDISDNLEATGAIPSGDEDIAFILQDRSFGPDDGTGNRPLVYQAGMMGQVLGMLGNRILVNGVEFPTLNVSTRQYRFRIFNGSNARTYDVALSNNAFFKVIATDGGLLATPVDTNHVMLSAGERAEIVVDFRSLQPGDDVVLRSRSFPAAGMMGGSLPNGTAFDIMRYKINTTSSDPVVLYTQLPNNAEIRQRLTLADATASRSFEMTINMTMMSMQFLINNKVFDINRVDELVANGATEVWSITNSSMMAHPFHAHAIQWQVLDRNLVPASGIDLGWKDTVLVQANETVRIIGRFDPVVNRGKYMYHCHILEHEDAGMMGVFEVQ